MTTDFLESAKKALDMFSEPDTDSDWPYVKEYTSLLALISIAESLKKIASQEAKNTEKAKE
jgi:hypothetical protein